MPYNGSGVYSPPGADFPAVAGTVITAAHFNNVINDIATALSAVLVADGQRAASGNISMGSQRLTNLGSPTASSDAATFGLLLAARARGNNKIQCPSKNLVATKASATTLAIIADALVLEDGSGNCLLAASFSETLDGGAAGAANQLDTGALATGNWYHFWAIGKSDGTVDSLLSLSSTAPTLPGGYTYKGYLGAVYYSATGPAFINFRQEGSFVFSDGSGTGLTGGTATSYTSVSLADAIPTTARIAHGNVASYVTAGTGVSDTFISPQSASPEAYGRINVRSPGGQTANTGVVTPFRCLVASAQTLYYKVSGVNAAGSFGIWGWEY